MPHLRLRPHVSFGLVDGRPVFLDLERDRYLALDSTAQDAFLRAQGGEDARPLDDVSAERLLATRLFTSSTELQTALPAAMPIPDRGPQALAQEARAGIRDIVEASFHVLRARRAIRSRPLRQIVAGINARHADLKDDPSRTEALSAAFLRARALVPVRPSCLQDTLALDGWLAARSATASLVFGVKLDPFAAHCWMQADRVVLNDAVDTVAEFAPVLVVA